MLFNLFVLSFLLPFVLSFQIAVPATVKVNNPTTVEWIRTSGDGDSFRLLLRKDSQSKGGEVIETVRSTSQSTGQVTFTAKEETQYLIEIIGNLDSIDPKNVLASSNKFTAIKDPNPPTPSTQTSTSSPPPPPPPTTTSTSSSSVGTPTTSPTSLSTTPTANTNSPSTGNGGDSTQNSITSSAEGGGLTIQTPPTPANPTPFSFLPSQPTASPTDLGTVSTASTPVIPQVSTVTVSGTLEPRPTTSLAGGASRSTKTGVIIGAVFGGLLFILLVFSLLFSYNRYQRRKRTRAFRRDLMVRPPGATPFSFGPAVTEEKDITGAEQVSDPPPSVDAVPAPTPPSLHSYTPSTQSAVSSSPSVFYTAVPKPAQPQLAPGFTFPAIRPLSTSETPKTDRQIAIQNKMAQLRNQLVMLQAQNPRASGYSSESSASMENKPKMEEIQRLRDELQRLGEIMNSDWALRQTNDIPAGLV